MGLGNFEYCGLPDRELVCCTNHLRSEAAIVTMATTFSEALK